MSVGVHRHAQRLARRLSQRVGVSHGRDAPTLDVVLLELDAWLEEQGLRNTPEHGSLAL